MTSLSPRLQRRIERDFGPAEAAEVSRLVAGVPHDERVQAAIVLAAWGTVEVSVAGEWSFAQTLRHLVMATDVWLGRGIRGIEMPFHPLGQPNAEYAMDGLDASVFSTEHPSYDDVLAVRAEHVAQVRDLLGSATPDLLGEERRNPWSPDHPETVLSCLHVILGEEWEHHRYAVRDLDRIEASNT